MFENLIVRNTSCRLKFLYPNLKGPYSTVWLDIECRKVKAPPSWAYKTRTQAFMVGIANYSPEGLWLDVFLEPEKNNFSNIRDLCSGREIAYWATKSYDQMVVEGRWTYGRRSPSSTPGPWPHLTGMRWVNFRTISTRHNSTNWSRSVDVSSKDVPEAWDRFNLFDTVILHNIRDLLDMLLKDSTSGEVPAAAYDILKAPAERAIQILRKNFVQY